jgi:hypothetical protein
MQRGRVVVSGNLRSRSASIFKVIFEHLCTVCIVPYSSFIIALTSTKLGMYTLHEKRNAL